jgi:hypothetical protein
VPKVQNLDNLPLFVNPVIDQNRRMNKLSNPMPPFHRRSDVREFREKIDVIQQSVAEPFRGIRKVGPRVGENFFKVRQRGF